jgi:threonylcarbamoyladenosine tRNA methylthiotransferase MtaB
MTSFSIQSFGCRTNQAEAFLWADEFQKHGLIFQDDYFTSDLVLVNTCTLTGRADRDVRSFIRKISRENPQSKLVVTGCFAERAAVELEAMPQIWRIFPNRDKTEITKKILSEVGRSDAVSWRPYRSRALIKIQDGCDYACTFCIIPSVRGRSVSLDRQEILSQAQEFVLTGVHLGLYGRDCRPQSSFLELLKTLCSLEGLGRIRLSSLDPRFMDRELLEYLTADNKICPNFHLSLQHGSDPIISKMGRNIGIADYQKILNYLHEKLRHVALGADIIVGFPGESQEDFMRMYRFLEESPLTYLHVFSFSPRPGTAAAEWKPVNEEIKKERAYRLRQLSREKNRAFRRDLIGRVCEAVVIAKDNKGARVLTGNYIDVQVPACAEEEMALTGVRIDRIVSEKTYGMCEPQKNIEGR